MISTLGRYKIISEIGQGAMGVVYKAVDPIIDRTVAIKTINLNLSKAELEEYEARFQQEIKAAARLNHPNIVTIYDVGKTEQVAYMAMEFLEGQELKDLIQQLTEEEQEVSYRRRILHGKIDILRAELVNRLRKKHEEGEAVITGADVQQLTDILSGKGIPDADDE